MIGSMMIWISALQLGQWADTVQANTQLPGLVADLIRATVPEISAMRFPNGEKGQIRGFDGVLESNAEGLNVPMGRSFWEFGTEKGHLGKAKKDVEKRSAQVSDEERAETTLFIVSARTWDNPQLRIPDWEAEQQKTFGWKKVTLLDGVAIEDWLRNCPGAAAWHARNTLKLQPQAGARSTDEFWQEYSGRFSPALTEEVLLCERDADAERMIQALLGGPGLHQFSGDTADEVIAFAVAAIRKSPEESRRFLEARVLIVDSQEAANALVVKSNLVFLPREKAAQSAGMLSPQGATVVGLGRQQATGRTALCRPSAYGLGKALETMGFSESEASTLARGSGRSLAALARLRPSGSLAPPAWVADGQTILPAILSGAWDANNELDKELVHTLAGQANYLTFERPLRKYRNEEDPPFDVEGTVWKVRAPMDAMARVGHLIGSDDLTALGVAMTTVFGTIEADSHEEDFLKKGPPTYSEWLRSGLAGTLLLIGAWQEGAALNVANGQGQRFANDLIKNLPGLTADHQLLASLRNELPLLAEAAPDPFLGALEQMLEGEGRAKILPLFEETTTYFAPSSKHTGLLWALETLAWDPSLFDRSVRILAQLADMEPGGKLLNRPKNSLREIFVPWFPNTNASLEQRFGALKEMLRDFPAVGWELLLTLLPSLHSTSSPTPRPRVRDIGVPRRRVTRKEYAEAATRAMMLALDEAGDSAARWKAVVKAFSSFPADEFSSALSSLRSYLERTSEVEHVEVWRALREVEKQHRAFPTAKWAMSADTLALVTELIADFAPADPMEDAVELFSSWPYEEEDTKAADIKRAAEVRRIIARGSNDLLFDLAERARNPHSVNQAVRTAGLDAEALKTIALQGATDPKSPRFSLAIAAFSSYVEQVGYDDATVVLREACSTLPAETVASLLFGWPDTPATWEVADNLGKEIGEAYWLHRNAFRYDGDASELGVMFRRYVEVGRPSAALSVAFERMSEIPVDDVLNGIAQIAAEINAGLAPDTTMVGYYVERALKNLDSRGVDDTTIAGVEFGLFTLLEHGNRKLKLFEVMARDPELYHSLIADVFRGDDDPPVDRGAIDALTRRKAEHAYTLLSKFDLVPGFQSGVENQAELTAWVDNVRQLGTSSKRSTIVDQYIGHVFAHAPSDPDGGWPHRFIRDEIERLAAEHVGRGLTVERFNMRGVYSKAVYEGGGQERDLSKQYENWAATSERWPRTAALLRQMSKEWNDQAIWADQQAEQEKLRD